MSITQRHMQLGALLASWGLDPLTCGEARAQAAAYLTKAAPVGYGVNHEGWDDFSWFKDGADWPASPDLARDFWSLHGELRSLEIRGQRLYQAVQGEGIAGVAAAIGDQLLRAAPVHYALVAKGMGLDQLAEYLDVHLDPRFVPQPKLKMVGRRPDGREFGRIDVETADAMVREAAEALRRAGLLDGWKDPARLDRPVVGRGDFERKLEELRGVDRTPESGPGAFPPHEPTA